MKTPSTKQTTQRVTKRPIAIIASKHPKHAMHIKIMRITDGSCMHLTSVCTMTITSAGKLEHIVIQNVQDRVNHPRWSGMSMDSADE